MYLSEHFERRLIILPLEEYQEGHTLLGQLLGIFKRNLAHEWNALVGDPFLYVCIVVGVAGERHHVLGT